MSDKHVFRKKVLTVFGTRPEIIKMAPIICQFEAGRPACEAVNVSSGQHTDLLHPFVHLFQIRIDHDLKVMAPGQTLNRLCARVMARLDPILAHEAPDLVLVQGDTTTAMAGAMAAFYRQIPVGHVEAGLRSGNPNSPYPEEVNRQVISRLATFHFAATDRARKALLTEGVCDERIFVTGNPVVDSLKAMLKETAEAGPVPEWMARTEGLKRVVLTAHRRESMGAAMAENFRVLRRFADRHPDVALIFPVHPNPQVSSAAAQWLSDHPRIHLIQPLDYQDFIRLLSVCWLIVSDSGGVQEEAPSLGKPLLILRENTERPEVVEAGCARLVGKDPQRLAELLEAVYMDSGWVESVRQVANPFGDGASGKRIARIILNLLGGKSSL